MSANISIAKSINSGKFIHIDNVNKEYDNDFVCSCGAKLIAVKTEARKKDWHFRHPVYSDIEICKSDALHKYAIELINENIEIVISEKLKLQYQVKGKEQWINSLYRSDITIYAQDKDVHFEVFVTHDLSNEKVECYVDSKIHCVRIDLSNPHFLTATPEEIKDEVLYQYHNKKTIYWKSEGANDNWIFLLITAIVLFFGFRWFSNKKR